MGYYTEIRISCNEENIERKKEIGDLVESRIGIDLNNLSSPRKMTDELVELANISVKFPETVFFFFGIGESGGDEWRRVLKAGQEIKRDEKVFNEEV